MKKQIIGVTIETKYGNKVTISGSGISIDYSLGTEDYQELTESLERIDLRLLSPEFDRTGHILDQLRDLGMIIDCDLEKTWEHIGQVYLEPYRILKRVTGSNEKKSKALRDFFKPIYFAVSGIKSMMEREIGSRISVNLECPV